MVAHPCDASAALRLFFQNRTGLHDRDELFVSPASERARAGGMTPAVRASRLAALIESVGHLWGDEVCFLLGVHLDAHLSDNVPNEARARFRARSSAAAFSARARRRTRCPT